LPGTGWVTLLCFARPFKVCCKRVVEPTHYWVELMPAVLQDLSGNCAKSGSSRWGDTIIYTSSLLRRGSGLLTAPSFVRPRYPLMVYQIRAFTPQPFHCVCFRSDARSCIGCCSADISQGCLWWQRLIRPLIDSCAESSVWNSRRYLQASGGEVGILPPLAMPMLIYPETLAQPTATRECYCGTAQEDIHSLKEWRRVRLLPSHGEGRFDQDPSASRCCL
jgi:hypothetical protein